MMLTINNKFLALHKRFPFAVPRLEWSLLSDKDVPGVLPAQGLEFGEGQRGLPVGHGAEGAVHKVHRGEPGYKQCTEHALEQHRSAEMIAKMLQYHGNEENLECESRQVVVQEKCFLHQEEGQVIHSPASTTDASR